MSVSTGTVTKNDIQKGTLAELPPRPIKGDIFIVLPDPPEQPEQYLGICFDTGDWELQEIPVINPLSVDDLGNLLFNGGKIIPVVESATNTYTSGGTILQEILISKTGFISEQSAKSSSGNFYDYMIQMKNEDGDVIDEWGQMVTISGGTIPPIPEDVLFRFRKTNPNHKLIYQVKAARNNGNTQHTIKTDSGTVKVL